MERYRFALYKKIVSSESSYALIKIKYLYFCFLVNFIRSKNKTNETKIHRFYYKSYALSNYILNRNYTIKLKIRTSYLKLYINHKLYNDYLKENYTMHLIFDFKCLSFKIKNMDGYGKSTSIHSCLYFHSSFFSF